MVEVVITILLVGAAGLILFRSLKRKAQGKCECGSCSSHCPEYKNQHSEK